MIPEAQIAEIRERTDIAALIGEYVPLKRSGASFKGLCPFHSEKSPSFYVHPDRGFFHCFGCGASGDVFRFLMRLEGRAFPEVARQLAERAGVELAQQDAREEAAEKRARSERDRLLGILDAAAGFFVDMMEGHRYGRMAREAVAERGITEAISGRYRLGYAPHGWDALGSFLRSKGASPIDCERVGLVVPKKGGDGHYDRFRHRLMFPISDVHGRIVAFSGRALPTPPGEREQDEPPAKYINSPEGPLYTKGEMLFGLHEARIEMRREGKALLCEGNFDVLALAQAGFPNTVAPLGTALTAAQAKLLRRYVGEVTLLFDGDKAGQKAVRAAQPLLQQAALSVRVAVLPQGSDPDSFLREEGVEALERRIATARGVVEHLIERAAEQAGDARSRADAVASLGPVIAGVESPVERRLYIERIARTFAIADLGAVKRELGRGARAERQGRRSPERDAPPHWDSQGPSGGRSAGPRERAPAGPPAPPLEKELVGAFLDVPELYDTDFAEKIPQLLTHEETRAIFRTAAKARGSRGAVDGSALLTSSLLMPSLSGEALSDGGLNSEGDGGLDRGQRESSTVDWLRGRLAVQRFDSLEAATPYVDKAVRLLTKNYIQREQRRLEREILAARRAGDERLALALTEERFELFRSAGSFRSGGEKMQP